jgi:hypothetical protein
MSAAFRLIAVIAPGVGARGTLPAVAGVCSARERA